MKTKFALFSALIMILTVIMPISAFSAADPGLENAIKVSKQMFDIRDDLSNFTYSVRSEGNLKFWMLNWSSKDNNGRNIEVSIDSTGDVQSYYNYKYTDYENIKKLPSISRAEAQNKAEEIIKKLNPDIFDNIKILERNQNTSITDNVYSFNYIRTYNGVVFPNNGLNVSINKQSGELEHYNKNWSKDLVFPSSEKALSLKEAQEAYIKNLGLGLTYKFSTEDKSIKVYGAYSPIYNSNYYIDALTGEKINLSRIYYNELSDIAMKESVTFDAGNQKADIALNPEEIAAVEEVSKLLSQEDAEKIARELKVLELDASFTLNSASLYKGWLGAKGYEWNLHFIKSDDKLNSRVSARIDAATGEITSFSTGSSKSEDNPAKFDNAAAKKAVEEFLNQMQPSKFKETKYKEIEDELIKNIEIEKPKYFSFQYTRMVNDVPFENNGITVGFDAVTGKITNYNLEWFDVEFPSLENAASLDKIYEIFFKEIGLELQYTTSLSDIIYTKELVVKPDSSKEVKLVYAVNSDKPSTLDAFTGVILDYNGKPYKEEKTLEYSDISGHYAQHEIEVLAQTGIGLEGPELRPNEQIKQKDFLLLISQVIGNGYSFYGKLALGSETETEDLYKLLIQEGIVKESEKNPDGPLTREDSVKFVIRAIKYEKIAALSDIFNCTFVDKAEINPELIGHVVLAKGLNIVSGHWDYFRPKAELKKADALIIIFNYLQI